MGNKNKKEKENNRNEKRPVSETIQESTAEQKNRRIVLSNSIISSVLSAIIVSVIFGCFGYVKEYWEVPNRLEDIEESLKTISKAIPEMEAAIEELQTIHANSGDVIRKELSNLPVAAITLKSEGRLPEFIQSQKFTSTMDIYLSDPSWSSEEVVAVGSDGKEYKAYSLYNTRIIFSYKEDGQDIVFSGQINDNNHWEGSCLFNVYRDGSFIIATEANYEDGKRVYYEQLLPHGDEWLYSERYSQEKSNVGDTWKYLKEEDISCQIDFDEPKEDDLIVPREFIIPLGEKRTGHYHGETAEGKYNDDSGHAYYISYDLDGFVKTVYTGKFAKGEFEDDTGEAWYITRESSTNPNLNYQYYKGEFSNGHPTPKDERTKNSIFDEKITLDEANRIVIGESFFEEISWDEGKFYTNATE